MAHPDELDEALLGAPVELTRQQVLEVSGVPLETARAVWSAMGFAEVADGVVAFTRLDAQALQRAAALQDAGVIDPDSLLVVARSMGQAMSRMAEAQVEVFRGLTAQLTVDDAMDAAITSAGTTLPELEQLVLFVWRRQFAAATVRTFAGARRDGQPVLAVGFVDLVDFTRSTRQWTPSQLERTLEHFERGTSLRVAQVGGRVVKTLGDGVLFVTDDPVGAVDVALSTVLDHEVDPELPSVRAGVALGPVLVRLGDVFGEPVNLASRLSEEARPGSLLVDDVLAQALPEGRYDVRVLRRRSVRGYRALTPHLVRLARSDEG